MFGIVAIALIASLNLILSLVITYFILKDRWQRRQLLVKDRESFHSALSGLAEKVRMLGEFSRKTADSVEPATQAAAATLAREQVKIALRKLRAGEEPGQVRRELGYSDCEMGILVASARRVPQDVPSHEWFRK